MEKKDSSFFFKVSFIFQINSTFFKNFYKEIMTFQRDI